MNPVGILFFCLIAAWISLMWIRDARANPEGGGLPGASRCPARAVVVAVAGTLVLLAAETFGEIRLGIVAEQKDVSWLALPMFMAAAVTEEVIFRAYLVVESRGKARLIASAVAFSLIFALMHDFLWHFEMPDDTSAGTLDAIARSFSTDFSVKAIFSTAFIFAGSLWFYFVRFFRWNPHASLLAPVVAHLTKNVAVFAIKLAQGHVTSFF